MASSTAGTGLRGHERESWRWLWGLLFICSFCWVSVRLNEQVLGACGGAAETGSSMDEDRRIREFPCPGRSGLGRFREGFQQRGEALVHGRSHTGHTHIPGGFPVLGNSWSDSFERKNPTHLLSILPTLGLEIAFQIHCFSRSGSSGLERMTACRTLVFEEIITSFIP